MAKRVTDNEILAAIDGATVHGVSLGPTVVDLAARLGVGENTVLRRLGSLVESGRAVSTPRTGILLSLAEGQTWQFKNAVKEK